MDNKRTPSKIRVRTKHHLPHSPSPSRSPSFRRRKSTLRKSSKSRVVGRNLVVLKRCKSEPILWRSEEIGGDDDRRRRKMSPVIAEVEGEVEEEEVLFRPQTCSDIFVSQDYVVSASPRKSYEGSKNDAKVLVSVTVEGSPGPIRTMVKLNCNVEEAIIDVVRKYNAEGRTPPLKLVKNDDDGASNFELHSSYFSLESLNKSEVIGNIGSRNFYLRKRNNKEVESTTIDSDAMVHDKANTPFAFLPFLSMPWKMKFMRKTRKLWRLLGCLQSSS